MKQSGNTICLGEHPLPCGLYPSCPFTRDADAVETVTVSVVTTDELFDLVASDESAHDGDFSNSFIGSEEFAECNWLVYESETGGVAVELQKDETHITQVIAVESWLAEAVMDLNQMLDEEYYTGNNSYWYDNIATEAEKEEIQQTVEQNTCASKQEVNDAFSDV